MRLAAIRFIYRFTYCFVLIRFDLIVKCIHIYNCGYSRTKCTMCSAQTHTQTQIAHHRKYDIIHLKSCIQRYLQYEFDGVSHVTVKIICYCFDVGAALVRTYCYFFSLLVSTIFHGF